jgi:hypothetical protein
VPSKTRHAAARQHTKVRRQAQSVCPRGTSIHRFPVDRYQVVIRRKGTSRPAPSVRASSRPIDAVRPRG